MPGKPAYMAGRVFTSASSLLTKLDLMEPPGARRVRLAHLLPPLFRDEATERERSNSEILDERQPDPATTSGRRGSHFCCRNGHRLRGPRRHNREARPPQL